MFRCLMRLRDACSDSFRSLSLCECDDALLSAVVVFGVTEDQRGGVAFILDPELSVAHPFHACSCCSEP